MIFDWLYLWVLLAATIIHYCTPVKHRTTLLITLSLGLIFYWSPESLLALLFTTVITFLLKQYGSKGMKAFGIILLASSILAIKTQLPWAGTSSPQTLLLIGYSYFTLQNISVLASTTQIGWSQLLLTNAFFPKFIAGPIAEPYKLTATKDLHPEQMIAGIKRILYGLVKKFVLADRLSIFVNNLFDAPPDQSSLFSLFFASMLFTFQMYLDFSAYSDLAIGGGKLLGYQIPENFDLPFRAKSIAQYWRKTHMTLIKWLTTHLYYPIQYQLRDRLITGTLLAIFITFTLSGLWHGLAIGFLIWGILNALYLMVEFVAKKKLGIQGGWWSWPLTLLLIILSNFFFRIKDWSTFTNTIEKTTLLFPKDWTVDFWAILADGGHLLQQYNILESFLLFALFFAAEPFWERTVKSARTSITFFVTILFVLIFFGYFHLGEEFIYVQF